MSQKILQNFGMILQWKFELLLLFRVSIDDLKLIYFRSLSLLSSWLPYIDGLFGHDPYDVSWLLIYVYVLDGLL